MSGPEERQRAVDLCSAAPMTTAQVVEHLGHPTRQCLERWLAKDPGYAGHMAKPIIPLETRTKAIEPVPGGMRQKRAAERLGAGVGAVRNRVRAYREGGMAALRPENRDAGDAEAPRRRIEEPELENALMREVAEAVRKRPGRRPAAPVEQGEDAAGRPSAPGVFTQPDDMLARHRAGQPPTAATPGSGLTDTPGRASGRPRRSPPPGAGTGVSQGQGHAPNPRLGEGAPQDHGRGRSDGARSRTTRVRLIRGRGHAGSRRPRRPRLHGWDAEREMARGHHPESGPGTGGACLSPPVGCHDGRIVAYAAGSGPDAGLADRMFVKAVETLPEGARPLVHSDRGCHCRWPGWLAIMDRCGLTRSMGAKGCSPDDATAEGFLGRMRTESVYPGRWGGAYP